MFADMEFLLQDVEPTVISGNGTETGQIIVTSVGGQNGQPKKVTSKPVSWLIVLAFIYKSVCLVYDSFNKFSSDIVVHG